MQLIGLEAAAFPISAPICWGNLGQQLGQRLRLGWAGLVTLPLLPGRGAGAAEGDQHCCCDGQSAAGLCQSGLGALGEFGHLDRLGLKLAAIAQGLQGAIDADGQAAGDSAGLGDHKYRFRQSTGVGFFQGLKLFDSHV